MTKKSIKTINNDQNDQIPPALWWFRAAHCPINPFPPSIPPGEGLTPPLHLPGTPHPARVPRPPQERPRRLQDAPKTAPRRAKTATRRAKTLSRDAKRGQEAPQHLPTTRACAHFGRPGGPILIRRVNPSPAPPVPCMWPSKALKDLRRPADWKRPDKGRQRPSKTSPDDP